MMPRNNHACYCFDHVVQFECDSFVNYLIPNPALIATGWFASNHGFFVQIVMRCSYQKNLFKAIFYTVNITVYKHDAITLHKMQEFFWCGITSSISKSN